MQLSGSPEHLEAVDEEVVDMGATGNTEFALEVLDLRRIGTGAWNAGRLSKILIPVVGGVLT
jgi:hypothetical protein